MRSSASSSLLHRARAFTRLAVVPWLVCLVLLACGTGDARSAIQVAVDSSGAYPVVRNTGEAEVWRAELVTTVGDDSTSGVSFGIVRSVLLDRRGRLFVVDQGLSQLSVFDSLGALTARWGRRGTGPGEYREPYSVAMLGDSVALLDPFSSRLSLFDDKGRWLRQWVVPAYSGTQQVRLYRHSDLEFWNFTVTPSLGRIWVRYRASGPVDTMEVHEPPKIPWGGVTCRVPNGGIASYPKPWGPEVFMVPVDSQAQASVMSTEYRIAIIASTGDTVRVIERAVAPAEVGDAEWDAAMGEFRTWKKRRQAECLSETFARPDTKPVIAWVVMDDEGQLWVESLTQAGRSFEVFGIDGRLRAMVTGLPSANGIDVSIVSGRIALVVPDADDIPRVQVFRIRKP